MDWKAVCPLDAIPLLGARVVRSSKGDIALFRTAEAEVFALLDACPHKQGPLSQGIVHGRTVTCPLHAWRIELADGTAIAPDHGCTPRYPVEIRDGTVFLSLTQEMTA
jgi:nitrite reductase (NADH) small subunit